jgi:hypothetical protein
MREKRNQKAQEMEAYLSSIENATDAQISYGGWRHYRPTGYKLGVDGLSLSSIVSIRKVDLVTVLLISILSTE